MREKKVQIHPGHGIFMRLNANAKRNYSRRRRDCARALMHRRSLAHRVGSVSGVLTAVFLIFPAAEIPLVLWSKAELMRPPTNDP